MKKKKSELRIGESTRLNNNDDVSISEEEEEEEVEKLEEEVKEIVKRVEASRSTFPILLKSSLSTLLSLQPPCGPHSDPGSSCDNSSTDLDPNDGEQNPDEVKLLRDKISSNIDVIPKVLKRMNECISRVDKLVSSNDTIHPVFKRKKS